MMRSPLHFTLEDVEMIYQGIYARGTHAVEIAAQ